MAIGPRTAPSIQLMVLGSPPFTTLWGAPLCPLPLRAPFSPLSAFSSLPQRLAHFLPQFCAERNRCLRIPQPSLPPRPLSHPRLPVFISAFLCPLWSSSRQALPRVWDAFPLLNAYMEPQTWAGRVRG